MATVTRYVDTGVVGGAGDGTSEANAFSTLSAAEAALDGGDNSGNDLVIVCMASTDVADSTAVTFAGFTYDSVTIQAASTDVAVKTGWDTARYRLSVASGGAVIQISNSNIIIDGIQAENTVTGDNSSYTVQLAGEYTGIVVRNCYLRSTDRSNGVFMTTSGAELDIYNTIIVGLGEQSVYSEGIDVRDGTANVYNCIITNYDDGIERSGGNVTVYNTAIFNCDDDVTGTMTIDYCAADDDLNTEYSVTHCVQPSGGSWANEFTDSTSNFTLKNTGNLYDAGVGPGTDANVPATDIDGDARAGATCDIGVDEYVAAGGAISGSSADGGTFSDSVAAQWSPLYASASDGAEFDDAPVATATLYPETADGVEVGDTPSTLKTLFGDAADGLLAGDAPINMITLFAVAADGTVYGDTATGDMGGQISGVVTDGITLTDTTTVTATLYAAVADGITLADLPTVIASLLASVTDGVTLSDVTIETGLSATGLMTMTASAKGASITVSVVLPTMTIS